MLKIQISNTAIIAIIFILTGVLTLVVSYLVHKDTFADGFKGGFWSGFAFIILGLAIVSFIAYSCSCDTSGEAVTVAE